MDQIRLEDALKIAKEVSEVGAHILEAGTPLIKSEGMIAIKKLREFFPGKTIVADMKTMDIGFLEAEIAIKAGADIVSVLGAAPNQTIKEALRATRENRKELMADLIGVEKKVKRAKDLEKLGVDYIIYHIGIDESKTIKDCLKDLESVINSVNIPIAVGGSINEKNIHFVIKPKIDIVIVGRFITSSPNPKNAASLILSAIAKA